MKTNVVYRATCLECLESPEQGTESNVSNNTDKSTKQHKGYIGETSRSLYERVQEHVGAAKNFDKNNFIVKHWANTHHNLLQRPQIKFEIKRRHKDPMSRLLHEAVMIEAEGVFNSKNEWRGPAKARLKVEEPEWIKRRKERARNQKDNEEAVRIETLKKMVDNKEKDDRRRLDDKSLNEEKTRQEIIEQVSEDENGEVRSRECKEHIDLKNNRGKQKSTATKRIMENTYEEPRSKRKRMANETQTSLNETTESNGQQLSRDSGIGTSQEDSNNSLTECPVTCTSSQDHVPNCVETRDSDAKKGRVIGTDQLIIIDNSTYWNGVTYNNRAPTKEGNSTEYEAKKPQLCDQVCERPDKDTTHQVEVQSLEKYVFLSHTTMENLKYTSGLEPAKPDGKGLQLGYDQDETGHKLSSSKPRTASLQSSCDKDNRYWKAIDPYDTPSDNSNSADDQHTYGPPYTTGEQERDM